MRVAIDARLMAGTNTGDSSYWTCLIQALGEFHPEIELLLFSNSSAPRNVPFPSNARWFVIPGEGKRWSLLDFPKAARKLGCDVTHVQYSLSPFAKNPVTTIHDVSFFIGPEWFSSKDLAILTRAVPLSAKLAKRVITVSETSRQEIVRYIRGVEDKVRVAPNATPPWIQPIADQESDRLIRQLGLPDKFLLTVGTQWARKNMKLAMDACRDQSVPLVLTGKQTKELSGKNVIPVGYVDEQTLCALYSRASIYLAPSLHEGFGIPILEAFKCGAPVICGYGGAMPEVAGNAGVVLRSYAAEDWSQTIKELLSNPSKLGSMRQAGIERERLFTWKASAAAHVKTYYEAMGHQS